MSLEKGIIKCDISDLFPIFATINLSNCKLNSMKTKVSKRQFTEKNK